MGILWSTLAIQALVSEPLWKRIWELDGLTLPPSVQQYLKDHAPDPAAFLEDDKALAHGTSKLSDVAVDDAPLALPLYIGVGRADATRSPSMVLCYAHVFQ